MLCMIFFNQEMIEDGMDDRCTQHEVSTKKRHRDFVIDSDSDEEYKRMKVRSEKIEVGSRNKSPKEIALENAIFTGERLSKKIHEIEQKFSDEHVEEKKRAKKICGKKQNHNVAKYKNCEVNEDQSADRKINGRVIGVKGKNNKRSSKSKNVKLKHASSKHVHKEVQAMFFYFCLVNIYLLFDNCSFNAG